jgi:hypothetical protein
MEMVFAVFYTWILINSAISPQLMRQTQLFTTAAVDLTTGVHGVMIFEAILVL